MELLADETSPSNREKKKKSGGDRTNGQFDQSQKKSQRAKEGVATT